MILVGVGMVSQQQDLNMERDISTEGGRARGRAGEGGGDVGQ